MDIDGDRLIDFDEVIELFECALWECHREDVPRVLVASDASGRGKSGLLRKLHYHGQVVAKVPVALVALNAMEEPTELGVIEKVADQLRRDEGVPFPRFQPLIKEFHVQNSAAFRDRLRGIVNMEAPEFHGGAPIIGGFAARISEMNVENLYVHGDAPWSRGHEKEAREVCTEAFFADLRSYRSDKPFAVLIDSVDDKCTSWQLRHWVLWELVRKCLIEAVGRNCRWVVVLAGQPELRELVRNRIDADYSAWTSLIPDPFGAWTTDHVRQFVRLHVGGDLDDPYLNVIAHLIKVKRRPLDHVIGAARQLWELASVP